MSKSEKIDLFLNKWVSRKLTVFIIASVALMSGELESTDWVIVATTYIAIEGATNITERLMKSKRWNTDRE